jgi:hypothetical protein
MTEATPGATEPKSDEQGPLVDHPPATNSGPPVVVEKPSIPSEQHRVENDPPTISIDRPSSDKSSSDRPSTDKPSPDKPRTNKPNATKSPPTVNKTGTPNAKWPPAPEWLDVLPILDLVKDDPPQRGSWSRDGVALKYTAQANTNGVLELPFTIRGSYKLRMDFTAAGTGTGFEKLLTFPVGQSWVRLVLDSGTNRAFGISAAMILPSSGGTTRSRSQWSTSVGTVTCGSRCLTLITSQASMMRAAFSGVVETRWRSFSHC